MRSSFLLGLRYYNKPRKVRGYHAVPGSVTAPESHKAPGGGAASEADASFLSVKKGGDAQLLQELFLKRV
jgi:hypothetical protein